MSDDDELWRHKGDDELEEEWDDFGELSFADDHRNIDPELADLDDLRRQLVQDARVDPATTWFGKGLTGQLEHDASRLRGAGLDAVR